jgi:four helix bundle protein
MLGFFAPALTASSHTSAMMAHERLQAWKLCHELVLAVYHATTIFPKHELYGLTSQARRAAFSAAVNIVEGSAKGGPAEYPRFLDISVGSLAELAYTLRVAKDLRLLDEPTWAALERLRRQAGLMTWRLYAAVGRAVKKA